MLVHIAHCFEEVGDNKRRALFGECTAVFHMVIELPIAADLHQSVEIVFICERAVIFDDVWMIQESLDLHLTNDLCEHVFN